MSIQYKNAIKSLADTNLNTVLTISTSAVAIVKSVYFTNSSTGTIMCNASMRDSSASTDIEFFRDSMAGSSQVNATPQGLNLEAGDAIKAQAASASRITVVVSYALINRENENG
jgi:hypothetical protein|tara:strand:+ start:154 stop:495 length:342 start_codon:yes stop_codon:yes gene_type:complete